MGNQLVAVAPAQIFPVEHYMNDVADLTYDFSLGSTRFLKVAAAHRHHDNYVVKVFAIHDASIDLKANLNKVLDIKKALKECQNCLPFQRAFVTDRAGFLVRQYIKDSLYDRISTRPFLSLVEKKWLAFQLLVALKQAHKNGVCHGDIKMENITITSWNWLVLTDFASFKPTFLPEDNPADFSYFFDTSHRRTCYIAPERFKARTFVDTGGEGVPGHMILPMSSDDIFVPDPATDHTGVERGEVLPSMDIFSAGCVMIELFTDGTPPFNFSQLLAYRAGEFEPKKVLDKIECPAIKELVTHMIQKEPCERLTAQDYLIQQRGKVFPEYFYSFLVSPIFWSDPIITPDVKMQSIYDNIDKVMALVDDEQSDFDSKGLILICSVITGTIRSLRFAGSKVKAFNILCKMCNRLQSEVILDRLLPYVITQLSDRFPAVRVAALNCLIECTKNVKSVPLSDANIFPEYILPSLMPLCHDRNDLVRAALASNIAVIAFESVRFLDIVMLHGWQADRPMPMYETELNVLHDLISEVVSALLADMTNPVKQALIEHSVTQLSVFFGKLKANDIILSHMITFLNDKDDPQLRISFYENIVGVAAFVGQESSPILLPLLQQGLTDAEEFVVSSCIAAMSDLSLLQLLQKAALNELLKDTSPYLLHPNLWIRHATAGFLATTAKHLDAVDTMVKLSIILDPFMTTQIVNLGDPCLILANVKAPIPRTVFDTVVKTSPPLLKEFLDFLETRKTVRFMAKSQLSYFEADPPSDKKSLFRRLLSEGMTIDVEEKLLSMKDKLIKISGQKSLSNKQSRCKFFSNGVLDVNVLKESSELHVRCVDLNSEPGSPPHGKGVSSSAADNSNEDWNQRLSGANESGASAAEQLDGASEASICFNWIRKNGAGEGLAPHQIEFEQQVTKKRLDHLSLQKHHKLTSISSFPASGCWRPEGTLLAHLHEHQGGINKLVRLADKPMFASASSDGGIRLWDCGQIEGSGFANKSHKLFTCHDRSSVLTVAVDHRAELLASGAENGSICFTSLDSGDALLRHQVSDELAVPIDMAFMDTFSSPLLVYATSLGELVGLDYRVKKDVFCLSSSLSEGVLSALAVSPDQTWAVTGTTSGQMTCWDLRFHLPLVKCSHPKESRIRQLFVVPRAQGCVLASVQGSNEVGLWKLESQYEDMVFRACSATWMSSKQHTPAAHSTCAMYSMQNNDMNIVLTAGTDMRIRYWDLKSPDRSYIMSGAPANTQVCYDSIVVQGTEIVQEIMSKTQRSATTATTMSSCDSSSKAGLDPPSHAHLDWITSLTVCKASNWYIVSGSKDGVIKVWK